jgi:hypothetical protein
LAQLVQGQFIVTAHFFFSPSHGASRLLLLLGRLRLGLFF